MASLRPWHKTVYGVIRSHSKENRVQGLGFSLRLLVRLLLGLLWHLLGFRELVLQLREDAKACHANASPPLSVHAMALSEDRKKHGEDLPGCRHSAAHERVKLGDNEKDERLTNCTTSCEPDDFRADTRICEQEINCGPELLESCSEPYCRQGHIKVCQELHL